MIIYIIIYNYIYNYIYDYIYDYRYNYIYNYISSGVYTYIYVLIVFKYFKFMYLYKLIVVKFCNLCIDGNLDFIVEKPLFLKSDGWNKTIKKIASEQRWYQRNSQPTAKRPLSSKQKARWSRCW